MNSVYVLAPNESWILDRFALEWNRDNADISVSSPTQADVLWLMADFCWQRIPTHLLRSKKVVTSIHHIVPEKFTDAARAEFAARDAYTTAYHVPNKITEEFIRKLTTKPIHNIPYWANDSIWRHTSDKDSLRRKHRLPLDSFVVGSFQRDTEGAGIPAGKYLPKLEKGPDLFCDYVIDSLSKKLDNVHVLLAGWRRQYIIDRLKRANVNHTYVELPTQEIVNELYQCLDLYAVTARHEGGPQALIECGLLNVPVISTPCGMAHDVLSSEAINEKVELAIHQVPKVDMLKLPMGYAKYRELIRSL